MAETEAKTPAFNVVRRDLDPTRRCQYRAVHPHSIRWTRMPRCGPSGFSEHFFFIQVVASSISRAGQDPGAGRTILLSREALDLHSLLRARMEDSEPRMPPA